MNSSVLNGASTFAQQLALAIVVLVIGYFVIKFFMNFLSHNAVFNRLEDTVKTFTLSFIRMALYVLLAISVIGIMGVPMASVITVLASAGLAVGLALQGALTNLAGGVMLMIFRPFSVGDYVLAAGQEGTVQHITLFYTNIMTIDNKRITIPNSAIMGGSITNFTVEKLRRVDLTFSCAKSESPAAVQAMMIEAASATAKVLADPAPFARLSGGTNEAMIFTVRCWCNTADYWDVYFDLNQNIAEALAKNGVKAPTMQIHQA